MPVSKSVSRSTSPVTSSIPSSRNEACRSSMTVKPAPSIAARLGVGSSNARSGPASRRRVQKSGCSSTGSRRAPARRASPCRPITWSKCPWLSTIASKVSGAHRQPVQVADHPVRGDARVEQHPADPAPVPHLDQRREAVLGPQHVDGRPVDGQLAGQRRQRARRAGQPPPPDQPDVGQQGVAGVVHHHGHVHAVDRLQPHVGHGRAGSANGGRNGLVEPVSGS